MQLSSQTLGRFEVHEELGRGAFATVYRAIDKNTSQELALKILHPQLLTDPGFVQHFHREAQTTSSLTHPNIIRIYDTGLAEGRLFLAMDLIRGGHLGTGLAKNNRYSWEKALNLLEQICNALSYAHKEGVLHRDLKPANILLQANDIPILSDFNIARALSDNTATVTISGGIVGTPSYIAPEIWENSQHSPQSDIYALACITYEMLTGMQLFAGNTPMQIMRAHDKGPRFVANWSTDIPRNLISILATALSRDIHRRYKSVEDYFLHLSSISKKTQSSPNKQKKAEEKREAYLDEPHPVNVLSNIASKLENYADIFDSVSFPPDHRTVEEFAIFIDISLSDIRKLERLFRNETEKHISSLRSSLELVIDEFERDGTKSAVSTYVQSVTRAYMLSSEAPVETEEQAEKRFRIARGIRKAAASILVVVQTYSFQEQNHLRL